jgi:hypothetical protein
MMDFERIRGTKADARCKNFHPDFGSPLYCDCGCQAPRPEDHDYDMTGITAAWVNDFKPEIALFRDGARIGSIDRQYRAVSLDDNEYLGVRAGSALAALFDLPVAGNETTAPMTAGSTADETASQDASAESLALAGQDARLSSHPGYCKRCHSFCYGDCQA